MDLQDRCHDQLMQRITEIRALLESVPLGENRQLLEDALKRLEDRVEETLGL